MMHKIMLVEYEKAFVRIDSAWFWNGCVGGAFDVRTVGTINADPALAFPSGPLEGGLD
jgi:hypothetical protein